MSDISHYKNQIKEHGSIQVDESCEPLYDFPENTIPRSCDCRTCEMKRRASVLMLKNCVNKPNYITSSHDPDNYNTLINSLN